MIKKIGYAVLIIVGLLFTVGYFRYNPTVNITNTIPAYADAIVRVNLREIEYNIIKDVMKHPFSYFKSIKNKSSTKTRLSLIDQIDIPSDVFFYTNYNNLKNTWISSVIHIKDKSKLHAFFKQEKYIRKQIKEIEYFTHKNLIYFIDSNELRVLFSLGEIVKVEEKINFIISNKSYFREDNKALSRLKNSDKLIAMTTQEEDFFELGIDSETLFLKGNLSGKSKLFLPYNTLEKVNSLVSVSGRINSKLLFGFVKEQQKKKFKKLTSLSLDSIRNHWNGNLEIELRSFTHKNDTIITYEYDDDFNKVEKSSIQKNIIPNINIKLGGMTLFDHLESKEVIKNVDGETLLVINPFFKTYANKKQNNLALFSGNIDSINSVRNEENKFSLFFDVEKYMKTKKSTYSISSKYFSSIKNVKAFVTKKNGVEMRICLKTTPQHFMLQLLK